MTQQQASVRQVTETLVPLGVPLWAHPEWGERFSWLVQGTTGVGVADDAFDLGLFGAAAAGEALGRWAALRRALGMPVAVHARQVHGREVLAHTCAYPAGLVVAETGDGHVSATPGLLLAVSVADCVPIFLVDARRRALALLHAGWRGVAAGILEAGAARLAEQAGSVAADLWLHCGPAICGRCYQVGPEVHAALRPDAPPPAAPTPVDLRAALASRARALGVPAAQVSVSGHCTRCGPGAFFSHRAGSPGRQMAVLGVRA